MNRMGKNEQKVVRKSDNSGNIYRVRDLVPDFMYRKTKSNHTVRNLMFVKRERKKKMKVKSYKIMSMLLLPFMLSLAGCSVEPMANEGSLKFTGPLKIPPLLNQQSRMMERNTLL